MDCGQQTLMVSEGPWVVASPDGKGMSWKEGLPWEQRAMQAQTPWSRAHHPARQVQAEPLSSLGTEVHDLGRLKAHFDLGTGCDRNH